MFYFFIVGLPVLSASALRKLLLWNKGYTLNIPNEMLKQPVEKFAQANCATTTKLHLLKCSKILFSRLTQYWRRNEFFKTSQDLSVLPKISKILSIFKERSSPLNDGSVFKFCMCEICGAYSSKNEKEQHLSPETTDGGFKFL